MARTQAVTQLAGTLIAQAGISAERLQQHTVAAARRGTSGACARLSPPRVASVRPPNIQITTPPPVQ